MAQSVTIPIAYGNLIRAILLRTNPQAIIRTSIFKHTTIIQLYGNLSKTPTATSRTTWSQPVIHFWAATPNSNFISSKECRIICPNNTFFRATLDFQTVYLPDTVSPRAKKAVRPVMKWYNCFQVHLKLELHDLDDQIPSIRFVFKF